MQLFAISVAFIDNSDYFYYKKLHKMTTTKLREALDPMCAEIQRITHGVCELGQNKDLVVKFNKTVDAPHTADATLYALSIIRQHADKMHIEFEELSIKFVYDGKNNFIS